ncbi:MAG: ImmA/IrrE family metallo-endopeptidase, partial [candidate division KSB1 bacterium]|nr:ImmA/IrrE family metallo-endopeptidase [candidate division KSB1 bacterium]
ASPELVDTVHLMLRCQAWFREQLVEEGWEPLRFVRSAKLTASPEEVARQMKEVLGLGPTWIADHRNWTDALKALIDKIDQAGILVAVSGIVGNNTHRILKVDEFRGFVLVDEYAPLVFVNGADAKAAQMFTLAHELAHIWFGQSAAFDLRDLEPAPDKIEQTCNRVAAEFLVPAALLRRFWPSVHKTSNRFQVIAEQFRVSEIVAARRALELSLITKEEFLRFYLAQTKRERRSQQGGGDFYATQNLRIGRRFGEAVVRAAREGRLLYREAYRLIGLHGQSFDRYAEAILGMPA